MRNDFGYVEQLRADDSSFGVDENDVKQRFRRNVCVPVEWSRRKRTGVSRGCLRLMGTGMLRGGGVRVKGRNRLDALGGRRFRRPSTSAP
jgi:hypothetical protein